MWACELQVVETLHITKADYNQTICTTHATYVLGNESFDNAAEVTLCRQVFERNDQPAQRWIRGRIEEQPCTSQNYWTNCTGRRPQLRILCKIYKPWLFTAALVPGPSNIPLQSQSVPDRHSRTTAERQTVCTRWDAFAACQSI
jgi:hypothetical protein